MQTADGPDAEERGVPNNQELLGKRKRSGDLHVAGDLTKNPEEGKVKVTSTTEGDINASNEWFKGGRAGPSLLFASASKQGNDSFSKDRRAVMEELRPLAKDGVNRSFAAVYDGEHSPDAAKGAADRLHLILQREDALVAKNSDEMTWSSDAAEGEEAEVRTEEGAVAAALTRAFRAVDEEVTGSVEAHKKGSKKGHLQGLQGVALLQVGEVLYTANTAGHAEAILCRGGKAVHISHKGHKGHKEKVGDLVDNVLLGEQDKVITRKPAVQRTELQSREDTFVVLASSALTQALSQQQVVDIVTAALQAADPGNGQAAAEAALQELQKQASEKGGKGVTAILVLLRWD